MRKDTATAIFDRFDEAGLRVSLLSRTERVDVTRMGQHEPEYVDGEKTYEVEVTLRSFDRSEVLRLIADVTDRHHVRLIPEMTSLRIVGKS